MDNNDATSMEQWLDAFSQGKITLAELQQKIDTDTFMQLLAEANTHRAAVNIVQRYNVLQQVKNVHATFTATPAATGPLKNKKASVSFFKSVLKVAAVFIFFIASAYLLIRTTNSNQNLYAQLSQEYYMQTNRANDTSHLSRIVKEFNNKQFDTVVAVFNKLSHPTTREYFLAGYACLQTGKYNAAANTFKSILDENKKSGDRLYNDEAEYYLVLSYIQLKQYKEAYAFAKSINQDQYHTYHEKISNWLLLKLKLMR